MKFVTNTTFQCLNNVKKNVLACMYQTI